MITIILLLIYFGIDTNIEFQNKYNICKELDTEYCKEVVEFYNESVKLNEYNYK